MKSKQDIQLELLQEIDDICSKNEQFRTYHRNNR